MIKRMRAIREHVAIQVIADWRAVPVRQSAEDDLIALTTDVSPITVLVYPLQTVFVP